MLYNDCMKFFGIVSLIFLFCMCILPVSAQHCADMPVTVEHFSMELSELPGGLNFDVYVPACIDNRVIGGYPVIYLLHGQDMGIEVWHEMGMEEEIQAALHYPETPLFYTVVPQEDQYLLSFSLSQFDAVILNHLIPWIDEHYNTCTDRLCRSIGGLSRGALWAEKIAFEHPDVFGSVSMMSMPGTFTDDQSFYYLTEKHKPDHMLRVRMDTGNEDNYRHEGRDAAAQLTYVGYPYQYYIGTGQHDRLYWKSLLSELFAWFTEPAQSSLTITQTAE